MKLSQNNNNDETSSSAVAIVSEFFLKNSKLTLIITIISIFLGFFSVFFIAKEEEPQIVVPMIDITTNASGLGAEEIEREITEVIERAMWGINGVEYIYSQSSKHQSLVTVRFKVNHSIDNSLLEVHHKLMMIKSQLPELSLEPQVKSYGIDDVAFLILSFSSQNKSPFELRQAIAPIARELANTIDINKIEFLGGQKRNIQIIADQQKLTNNAISIATIQQAIRDNQMVARAGKNLGNETLLDIDVGARFSSIDDIKNVAVGNYAGRVVRIKDVAQVVDGAEELSRLSTIYTKDRGASNAVALSFSKRKGVSATILSQQIIKRTATLLKDSDIKIDVMRDYGESAKQKSFELILHLFIATILVSCLIALFMGLRCATIIAIAIPVTLSLTLFAFHFLDYTLNRVTLFALVFAIGILVDDAIVVVENIERHLRNDGDSPIKNIVIKSVAEIAGSTILATFAVIFAILPMSFVEGLMGPYMKPIPIGSAFAMIFSLLVAFIVTPWATLKILKKNHSSQASQRAGAVSTLSSLDKFYEKIIHKLLDSPKNSIIFIGSTIFLLVASCSLIYFGAVKVKMLPFDNKTEFQIIVDYPTSTPLEKNHALSQELAQLLLRDPNIEKVQIFSGEPAPFSFSGMVKHTYLRHQDYMSDLQIVITNKDHRKLSSHEIIKNLRPAIEEFSKKNGAIAKILEIPPGPPVLATLVAEIYGETQQIRDEITQNVAKTFALTPSVVEVDSSLRKDRSTIFYELDYQKGSDFVINSAQVARSAQLLFSNNKIGTLIDDKSSEEVAINLSFPPQIRSDDKNISQLKIISPQAGIINASEVLKEPKIEENRILHRKNLIRVNYVTAELSGDEEAPIYAINKIQRDIKNIETRFMSLPWEFANPLVKWDGEIFITLEVFRDLGLAFIIAIIAIYILILIKFNSFSTPIVVMAPIPISLIGVMFGHYVTHSYFTATSMIGFMAGAGIIVRNSIILIDFIEQQIRRGIGLKEAVISGGILRFRPMLLTALAVIFGSLVMLFDPIFSGFAISLIFGEISATILSRFVVPIIYYFVIGKRRESFLHKKI